MAEPPDRDVTTHADDDPPRSRPGRIAAAQELAKRRKEDALRYADEARERSATVATGFAIAERDRERLGGLLAGAVAYRMFLWLLPYALLVVGILGAITGLDEETPDKLARDLGMQSLLTDVLKDAASQRGWWIAILLGLFGTAYAGIGAVRSLRIAHAAAWGVAPDKMTRPLMASGVLFGIVIGLSLASVLVGFIRERSPLGGLVAILLTILLYFIVWLRVSAYMPRRPTPMRALVPGALIVAVGLEILHMVTVYYLADRAERATSVYGTIGAALTLLLWLFILARLMVGGAVVNAELWREKEAARAARASLRRHEASAP
ncbi:MAG: YihY/virulence factor BrkB family protein [Thermoleophilia bacterium]